jgi:hypothetical protein
VREGAWSQVSVVCVRVCGSQVWPEEEEEQLERELHQSRVRKGKIPLGYLQWLPFYMPREDLRVKVTRESERERESTRSSRL